MSDARKPSVLIVDDSSIIRGSLSGLLERSGFAAHVADGWYQATQVLSRHQVDLVLLDVEMPDVQGPQVCRLIRRSHKNLWVLLYSSRPLRELLELAEQCGADGAVSKTEAPVVLLDRIRDYIGEKPEATPGTGRFSAGPGTGRFSAGPGTGRFSAGPGTGRYAAPSTASAGPSVDKTILIVDDDPSFLKVAKEALSRPGYDVEVVTEWASVSSLIRTREPEVVLLTVALPNLRGDVLCRILRARYSTLPIFLMSNIDAEKLRGLQQSCSATGTLTRPSDGATLWLEVARILRSPEVTNQAGRS